MTDCDCKLWGTDRPVADLLGNGHHHNCGYFVPDVGAVQLLRELVAGIKEWGAQEDGIPEWLWDAYARAVFITEGRMATLAAVRAQTQEKQ